MGLVVVHVHDAVLHLWRGVQAHGQVGVRRGRDARQARRGEDGSRTGGQQRKVQRKAAALAGLGFDLDRALVGAHQAMHHSQAQARALAHGLGGEKGHEDFACHIVWDDVAVIADLQLEEGRRGALSG